MIRTYRVPPFAFVLGLLLLGAFVIVGLPLLFFLIGSLLLVGFVRKLLFSYYSKRTSSFEPGVSDTIKNEKIGAYRIKKNDADPSVIEVIDP